MDILSQRPNVLFLIAVRKPTLYYNLLCIKKLLSNVYLHKVVRALSKYVISTENNELCEVWRLNGDLHRENGPAFIRHTSSRITMEWCIHGKAHNETGPAILELYIDGDYNEEWYLNGKSWEIKDRTQYMLSKHSKIGDHNFGDLFGLLKVY